MKLIKIIFLLNTLMMIGGAIAAQKQSFGVVSFTAPKGWQQQQSEGGMQLSLTDKKTGAYAIALIVKASVSEATAHENFNAEWNKLIKGSVQVSAEPVMLEPTSDNGWEILSGTANYTDGSQKGVATLLTATGGGQVASVVLMANTDKYQNELLSFINSLELKTASQNATNHSKPPVTNNTNAASLVGLWTDYLNETAGYINGTPQYTAGYFRREYVFYADGTYLFRVKNWSTIMKEILFVYETGIYSISGNKLTITPRQGKGEWWSKAADGTTKGWGSKVRSATWKLETVTYNFDLHYYSGTNETYLILHSGQQTERDGNQENTKASFKPKSLNQSMIDIPPGIKTGFENKQLNTSNSAIVTPPGFETGVESKPTASSARPTTPGNSINSQLAGKIWEAKSQEKYGVAYGDMSGFYTGGFWIYQYKFNADGTYHFVYNAASALATNPVNVLQYETGTYAVTGNQLTITPGKGINEEWSVGKINGGMSAEHIREILETRVKRSKTTARKLEKITYSFTIEYWQGNNANTLCLKHTQNTVREGSPGQNNQSCFFETTKEKSVKLPVSLY